MNRLAALTLILSAIAAPALAQTAPVVLACVVERTDVTTYPVGRTIHFRIEPERFLQWDADRGQWSWNLCANIEGMPTSICTISPQKFEAIAPLGSDAKSVTIDRVSGAFQRRFISTDFETLVAGRCRPSEEPRAAATQF